MFKENKQKSITTYHSPEYKQFMILRIVNMVFIGMLMAGVIVGSYFIYKNIFYTIENSESLFLTQNMPITEVIDFNKYEKVRKAWQEKNLGALPKITRDPFNNTITTTTPEIIIE